MGGGAGAILTIDVGNTHLSCALVRGRRIVRHAVIPQGASPRELRKALRSLGWTARRGPALRGAVLASVVPARSGPIARLVERATGAAVRIFPRDFPGILHVRPKPKNRVGSDRLAAAVGALALADGDAVIVDVGTAVTVDLVTARGVFEGGAIAPGPRLGARALASHTAQLPLVRFARAKTSIGRSTEDAIRAGLWFGFRGLVRALVEETLVARPGAPVFVSGGDGGACFSKSGIRHRVVPGLVHLGLAEAFGRRRGRA